MKYATFSGGIHIQDRKELTKDKPVTVYLPKGEMVFYLQQHIGAMSVPAVRTGDKVLMGEIIAQAKGNISANIVSSVSGTVSAIEKRLAANGALVDSIVIENDGLYTPAEGIGICRDYRLMPKEEIIEAIKDAGIVGLGGAGFPTHVKLTPYNPECIDTVIVNAAECEPYLTADYRAIMEQTDKLITGLKIVISLFPKSKGIIAVEDNKPDAAKLLRGRLSNEPDISVIELKTKYPQGCERNLIYAITKREINSKKLPCEVNCIVNNVNTIIAIYDAVVESTPLMEKVISVTGDGANNPCNIRTRIGTRYKEILEAAGGAKDNTVKFISGGPMMGNPLSSLDIGIEKTSSSLLCLTDDETDELEPSDCIRCGRCLRACPESLVPHLLLKYTEKNNAEKFINSYGFDCCECGSCSYVCPAKRRITYGIKKYKQSAREYLKANQNKSLQEAKK